MLSLPKTKIRVLLLEGVNDSAARMFEANGYTELQRLPKALGPKELRQALSGIHMLGIRSRTQLTAEILEAADRLLVVGCFSVGTNQVDLDAAVAAQAGFAAMSPRSRSDILMTAFRLMHERIDDLALLMTLEMGKPVAEAKGEILELKNTINTMVDQLNAFAGEVTRVAREVGTEGKLGGQAVVRGVAGAACPAAAGVGAFFQIGFDDLAFIQQACVGNEHVKPLG